MTPGYFKVAVCVDNLKTGIFKVCVISLQFTFVMVCIYYVKDEAI